ncbi:MAG: hypothetical protein ACNA8P_02665 [Phycisphaerales bacterium]
MHTDPSQNPFSNRGASPFGSSSWNSASQFRTAARQRFVTLQAERSLPKRILGTIIFLIMIGLGVILGALALMIGVVVVAMVAVLIAIRRLLTKLSGRSNEGRSNVRIVRSGER